MRYIFPPIKDKINLPIRGKIQNITFRIDKITPVNKINTKTKERTTHISRKTSSDTGCFKRLRHTFSMHGTRCEILTCKVVE